MLQCVAVCCKVKSSHSNAGLIHTQRVREREQERESERESEKESESESKKESERESKRESEKGRAKRTKACARERE